MAEVFVIDSSGALHPLNNQPYEAESVLQRLLAEHPELLAGELVDPETPRRWLLVSREAPLGDSEESGGRWSVDHLLVDQEAIPTIVEVKRSSDTRIRREVIGQILEYAANGVMYWPVDKLQAEFEGLCARDQADPAQRISERLGINDPGEFWNRVRTNLRAGKVRLILVADDIPQEVRRIVEFLNGQMNTAEFLAVEIKQFRAESNLTTLVPRVYGQTEQASGAKGQTARQERTWTVEQVLEDLDGRCSGAERLAARRVLDWCRQSRVEIKTGRGTTMGSFSPWYPVYRQGREYGTPLFTVYSTGSVAVPFMSYRRPPFDAGSGKMELLERLNQLPGIALPDEAIGRQPTISLSALADGDAVNRFLQVFDWTIERLAAHVEAARGPISTGPRTQS